MYHLLSMVYWPLALAGGLFLLTNLCANNKIAINIHVTKEGAIMRNDLIRANTIDEALEIISVYNHKDVEALSMIGSEEVKHILTLAGGFWEHNSNSRYHAVTRRHKHTKGYVSVPAAIVYPAINRLFARLLVEKIRRGLFVEFNPIDLVVGSDHAAALFSYAVADILVTEFGYSKIRCDFTEKVLKHGEEIQKWSRHIIGPRQSVLHIEELCTSFLTVQRVRDGIANFHIGYPINYVPVIGMVVNRTGTDVLYTGSGLSRASRVVALLNIKFDEYDVENGQDCPLCASGSEPLEDVKKDAATWAKLTGH